LKSVRRRWKELYEKMCGKAYTKEEVVDEVDAVNASVELKDFMKNGQDEQ
jgi:hypothetical protein